LTQPNVTHEELDNCADQPPTVDSAKTFQLPNKIRNHF